MRQLRTVVVSLAVVLLAPAVAVAATKSNASTSNTKTTTTTSLQSVAESYATTKTLQAGLLVQLDQKNKSTVEPVTYKAANQLFGVTVPSSATPVSLTSGSSAQQTFVVTSGRYSVLVTTQDGPIAIGDLIGVSAVDGLGMKADTTEATVLGRATTSFDGKNNVLQTTSLKTANGGSQKVAIGSVSVDIAIVGNPNRSTSQDGVPNFVQKIAIAIVGKPIGAAQLYAAVIILIIGMGVVSSLLYGGIQTAMIAVGRNPLARSSITRNMIQVIATGIMIFIGCLIAVYLIMKI